MGREIERKFLISDSFEPFITRTTRMTQGYLVATPERTVRVRRAGARAFLTIKGALNAEGTSRSEWEYEIPVADAEEMLALCEPGIIDKTRHEVPCGDHTVEIDVFHGANEGLVVAEIELAHESEVITLPSWIGREVTGDRRYYNAMLARHPFDSWPKT